MCKKILLLVLFTALCHVLCTNLTSTAHLDRLSITDKNGSLANNSVHYKENDLIETSCHVKTEELVAIAKVSVSSALENLCNYSKVVSNIIEMERRIKHDIHMVQNLLLTLTNKVTNIEKKINNNS